MIKAKVLAKSLNVATGTTINTVMVTIPRIILAELNTHRVFSRNSASSRAIPALKMIEAVEANPFIPSAFQKAHTGMQGTEYFDMTSDEGLDARESWKAGLEEMLRMAMGMYKQGITKQLINRVLEPYMWHTVLITATEWDNFFDLRCPLYKGKYHLAEDANFSAEELYEVTSKGLPIVAHSSNTSQAEIHIQQAAEAIERAIRNTEAKALHTGDIHLPFGLDASLSLEENIKVNVAKAARVSYTRIDTQDSEKSTEEDIKLYDRLFESGHMSPFEHVAFPMGKDELDNYVSIEDGETTVGVSRNFRNFIQYRSTI